jgi:hypothetical protein
MELLILNTNLESVAILDTFESLIWTERYCGYGDFENYSKASMELFSMLRPDYYLWTKGSNQVMIVEDHKIKYDAESGAHLITTGRSLESILDRRIVWETTILSGSLQNGIKKLIDESIISPTIADRTIPNFIFELSTDPVITSLTVKAQFTRTNLYETIVKLCTVANIGFRVTLSDTNQFVFKLYAGADRSYDQLVNPYVIFSPKFENILNSDYFESKKNLKNVTVVAGEGEGDARKTTVVGSGVGLNRREMYTDARELSQTVDEVTMSDTDYLAQLAQKGAEDLSENTLEQSFEGQVDTSRMFTYGEDFFIGDVVQIVSEYGIEATARITEIIHSQSTDSVEVYPTFTILE